ncbi:MAG: glutathione-disulfide reductase [Alphaproteobacteria bacterium]|nr:MAG: glutathione-disulfide reductase [Alphaproteobacteria bacterium]
MADTVDLFVIGGGSGGVRAARVAAEAGARVALAEEYRMGGTCVIRGCVPKKLMVYAADFSAAYQDAVGFGWDPVTPRFHWDRLIAAKDREIARLEGLYRKGLETAGVRIHDARAVLDGPNAVRLSSGERITARHILIATGGRPFKPDIPGAELAITSDDVFHLPGQPRRVVIQGGGYIACEFACIFNGLGSDVTLVHRRDELLRGFDRDLRAHLAAGMAARGIALCLRRNITAIARAGDALAVHLDDGGVLDADCVMMATGRVPNTAGLGLAEAGVVLAGNGAVEVDAYSHSSVPSIHAVGDVTDRLALTPVAIREGQALAETLFGPAPVRPDHALVATAVFTRPEIGTVGLTEDEAREEYDAVVYRAEFRPMLATLSGREERMLMKLVVDAASRRVLGCHIAGPAAAEMIQLAAVALKMGATKEDFDRTVAVHPTAAEELVTMRRPSG